MKTTYNMNSEFLDLYFPLPIPTSSITGPEYSTSVISTISGNEQRNVNWSLPKRRFQIAKGIHKQDEIDNLIAFFHLCKGKAMSFRIQDWSDYKCEKQLLQPINTDQADGFTKINNFKQMNDFHYANIKNNDISYLSFQLVKNYRIHNYTITRKIHKPCIESIILYERSKNNSDFLVINTSKYRVNNINGHITFFSPHSQPLYADFSFDIAVRFDTDQLPIRAEGNKIYTHSDINLVEVKFKE